jgi:glycosyltransferase involved in cell wall biosynthesis
MPERLRMGWDSGDRSPWILRTYENVKEREEYQKWWREADVVLCGDVGSREKGVGLMTERVARGKLTFYSSERWWKPPLGMARLAHIKFALTSLRFRRLAGSKNFHYLPIGLYAVSDMERLASFGERSWLFGYFIETPTTMPEVSKRAGGIRVLWAGRMLRWKRVDTLIRGFRCVWDKDKSVRLLIIGDGAARRSLFELSRCLGLTHAVEFQPNIPREEVLRQMQASHVYVLPSDGGEGWGAVVNEAMTQGCMVIASESTGAGRTMIHHEKNGLLFRSGDWKCLGDLLCRANFDEALRLRLASAGQRGVYECWSPKIAAERFVNIASSLLSGLPPLDYTSGPMSRIHNAV